MRRKQCRFINSIFYDTYCSDMSGSIADIDGTCSTVGLYKNLCINLEYLKKRVHL